MAQRLAGFSNRRPLSFVNEKKYTYNHFRELKFLVRRAVFLGNYHILSIKFLEVIISVFNSIDIFFTKIEATQDNDQSQIDFTLYNFKDVQIDEFKRTNLRQFHIYLLQNFSELFEKNGWCGAKLLNNIALKKSCFLTSQAEQFIRMLKIETGTVLNDFYELLHKDKQWRFLHAS